MQTDTKQPQTSIVAYKAFNADWTCRDFQYEVGKTYTHDGAVEICGSGFHACENPFDVLNYYPLAGSKIARVTVSGQIDRQEGGDSKICGGSITIDAELHLPDFIKAAVKWVIGAAKGNVATGYSGHAAATGYSGHAAATGDRGHAAATGYRGHAAATGYSGHAAATGKNAIAAALGYRATATAREPGSWIVLAYTADDWTIPHVRAGMVGRDVEAGKTYRLNAAGEFEVVA